MKINITEDDVKVLFALLENEAEMVDDSAEHDWDTYASQLDRIWMALRDGMEAESETDNDG